MIRLVARLSLLALTFVIPLVGRAQEWTRFRGPNGTGQSEATTVPGEWTDKDYNWRVKLPGKGHAAPVLWGDRLFVTSGDPKNGNQFILAFDAKSGKELWKKEYPSSPHTLHGLNTFASSTPAVDADHLYVAWSEPKAVTLLALKHDGAKVWQRELGPYVSQHGFGVSPIVHGDMVVLGNDQGDESGTGTSFLVAVDRQTGEDRWRTPRKTREVAYSTPCVYRTPEGGEQLIFNSGAEGMTSVDPKSGKVNWQIDLFDKRSCSSPIIVGDLIYGSCGSGAGGGNYVVAIRAPNGKDRTAPEIAYKMSEAAFAPYVPGFVAKGGHVFLWGDKGFVACLKADTGKVVWKQRIGGAFYGSPIRVSERIYCMDAKGTMYVIAADTSYKLISKVDLGEPGNSTPAVAGGVMYFRTESHLMSLGGAK